MLESTSSVDDFIKSTLAKESAAAKDFVKKTGYLYHISPLEARESILEKGILGIGSPSYMPAAKGITHQQGKAYNAGTAWFYTSPSRFDFIGDQIGEEFLDEKGFKRRFSQQVDVWRVKADDIIESIKSDENMEGYKKSRAILKENDFAFNRMQIRPQILRRSSRFCYSSTKR